MTAEAASDTGRVPQVTGELIATDGPVPTST